MKKYVIILLAVVSTALSCSSQLDVTPPNNITNEQVLDLLTNGDDATRETILNGIAASLPILIASTGASGSLEWRYNHFTGMAIMRGFEGNDMIFANIGSNAYASAFGREDYQWVNIRGASGTTSWYWKIGWDFVAAANKVLPFLPDAAVGDNAMMKRYQAQALFMRAFAYNYLLENYQDAYELGGGTKLGVPLYTTFDPAQPYQARATLDQCYKLINDDLDKAVLNLGDYFTDNTVNDIDAGVVLFLRARVALCMGNWARAIADCQKIIDHYGDDSFITEAQYVAQKQVVDGKDHYFAENSGFLNLAKNPETIYGFFYSDGTAHAQSYWLNVYANNTSQGSVRGHNVQIDQRLYDKIATGDYRKDNFVGSAGAGAYTYPDGMTQNILPYANLKFASTVGKSGGDDVLQASTTANQNDWTLFRLSEVYLMLAEAQARSTNETAAKATLDKLIGTRTNGLYDTDTYPSHTGLSTLEKIQLQTRIEMWGEKGLEFYNNKRWNIPVNRSGSANHWGTSSIPVAEMTMQIPLQSVSLNGLLEQNP